MLETVVDTLPFAVAGAFMVSWIALVIALLATPRGAANAMAFIGGIVVFRLALAALFRFVLRLPPLSAFRQEPSAVPAVLMAAAGLALLVLGGWEAAKGRARSATLDRWAGRLGKVAPRHSFLGGVGFVAAPGLQYIYFLAGLTVILRADLGETERALAYAAFMAVLHSALLAPLAAYALLGPDRAASLLEEARQWLLSRGRLVGAVVVGVVGALLVWRALPTLIEGLR